MMSRLDEVIEELRKEVRHDLHLRSCAPVGDLSDVVDALIRAMSYRLVQLETNLAVLEDRTALAVMGI